MQVGEQNAHGDDSDSHGDDHVARVMIILPKHITEEQKKLFARIDNIEKKSNPFVSSLTPEVGGRSGGDAFDSDQWNRLAAEMRCSCIDCHVGLMGTVFRCDQRVARTTAKQRVLSFRASHDLGLFEGFEPSSQRNICQGEDSFGLRISESPILAIRVKVRKAIRQNVVASVPWLRFSPVAVSASKHPPVSKS